MPQLFNILNYVRRVTGEQSSPYSMDFYHEIVRALSYRQVQFLLNVGEIHRHYRGRRAVTQAQQRTRNLEQMRNYAACFYWNLNKIVNFLIRQRVPESEHLIADFNEEMNRAEYDILRQTRVIAMEDPRIKFKVQQIERALDNIIENADRALRQSGLLQSVVTVQHRANMEE